MTPRQIARGAAERAVNELRRIVSQNIADHHARPVYWLAFHRELANYGPKVWRPWHRWRARRMSAAVRAGQYEIQCHAALRKAGVA